MTILEKFLAKVKVNEETGCWEWTAQRAKGKWPYGHFRIGKKTWLAHRASWFLHRGVIPDGMDVCHRCDNPSCVNAEHLFLGTQLDNTVDAARKGRLATGRQCGVWTHRDRFLAGMRNRVNGAHTHPERMPRGEKHGGAKLTEG